MCAAHKTAMHTLALQPTDAMRQPSFYARDYAQQGAMPRKQMQSSVTKSEFRFPKKCLFLLANAVNGKTVTKVSIN